MTLALWMRHGAAAVTLMMAAGAGPVHAQNLIKNGGFETPLTPQGTYTVYSPGQMIEKWLVTGGGNVATVNDYSVGGVAWIAHKGHAYLDLTGTCDCGADSGVAQTFKTVSGTSYELTFWVGNTYIPGDGTTSTIDAYLGTTKLLRAKNTRGKGSTKELWKKFSATFTATASSTTLSFVNGDPNGDEQNGLDDVTVAAE